MQNFKIQGKIFTFTFKFVNIFVSECRPLVDFPYYCDDRLEQTDHDSFVCWVSIL